MARRDWIRLVLISFAATGLPFLILSLSPITQKSFAYSSGPPAGFTGAPGEFTCAECHVPESQGSGQTTLTVPPNYVPGHTYQIAVHHINNDPSRIRWGFELTALDDGDQKAGELQSIDSLTKVLNNQGPAANKQYIEHTSLGTFFGQTGGADWTFNWTAPATDVGRVTFYVAGNQANGDRNTSGDFIHFTFAETFAVNPPQLILDESGPDANQAAALESLLFVRDPFKVQSIADWLDLGSDRNTRVIVFAANLQLNPGETVVVNLIDSGGHPYDVTAEVVQPLPNTSFTQVTFRLPDNLAAGTCLVTLKAHGQTSNTGTIRIVP
jgi:hypothetical protein